MGGLYDVLESRKIKASVEAHGLSVSYDAERAPDAGAPAQRASAARLAACQVFWRRALPGSEAHHAYAGSAHGLRERALPQHGRVLGTWHGNVHDSRRHLHTRLWILRRAFGQASRTAGRRRALSRGRSRRKIGAALRGGDFGEPRRPA